MINFELSGNWLVCTIDDDGIGREKAMEIKLQKKVLHNSVAMTVTEERLKLVQTELNVHATVEITDKTDSAGIPTGTLVTIKIPLPE